jgi:SAM-dependent methyltransferase
VSLEGVAPRRPAKKDLVWGAAQAEVLWTGLYERYEPRIDASTVLDMGCSWGYMLRFLAERFQPRLLIGTDVSPWWERDGHGWDYGRLGDRLQFHVGDLREIGAIPERSVDFLLSTSVLQYMTPEQLAANLSRAYDLLRPGGEMILRTRVWTSYIGADLHTQIGLPSVHMLYPRRDLDAWVEARGGRPKYMNALTASTYLTTFVRAGFEVLDARRRMNSLPDELRARLEAEYPWIAPEELHCAELEARLLRPFEADDLRAVT